jgi:hypothetical protein
MGADWGRANSEKMGTWDFSMTRGVPSMLEPFRL